MTNRKRIGALSAALAAGVALTGCVVVPLNPDGTPAYPAAPAPAVVGAPPPTNLTLPVRLYPTNEAAAGTGMLSGTVTSNLNGKGTFTLNVGGETMSGEATRTGGANGRSGVASAYGARGGYANCEYTMNSNTQGSGRCTFSSGAVYQLHIGA
ncbi:MAG: hypothetical protein ACK6C0_06515 [Betaproteobacteria bacterium]